MGRSWAIAARGCAVVAVALAVAACGNDAKESTGSGSSPAAVTGSTSTPTASTTPASTTDTAPTSTSHGAACPSWAGDPKADQWDAPPARKIDTNATYVATFVTNKGTLTTELFAKEVPVAVNNFVFLACHGFYDGTSFHRIIKGFMIQGGDPTGTGSGGPGYSIPDEPVKRSYDRGILAYANSGPNTSGSQFFIMHADYQLPPNYTIFGKVTKGLDVVDALANVPVEANDGGEASKPTEDVTLKQVTISH